MCVCVGGGGGGGGGLQLILFCMLKVIRGVVSFLIITGLWFLVPKFSQPVVDYSCHLTAKPDLRYNLGIELKSVVQKFHKENFPRFL